MAWWKQLICRKRMKSGVHKTIIRDSASVTVRMAQSKLPHFTVGCVIKGFGRGSRELGIPTANLPTETIERLPPEISTGIYFGWANVDHGPVYKMVMSVGWNPYYKNKVKSMEVYLMHEFEEDFYGSTLRICMLGYIRPEMDFENFDELLSTIKNDIKIAKTELDKPEFSAYQNHSFFKEDGVKETLQKS